MIDSRAHCFAVRACLTTVAALLLSLPIACQPPPGASPNVTGTAAAPAEPEEPVDTSVELADATLSAPETADSSTAPSSTDADGGAKLSGRVTFDGTPPERRPINMSKDKKCIELHGGETVLDEAVLVAEDGSVKNAFVYIRRGAPKKEYPVPDDVIKVDQKDCMYQPRVQGMLLGQRMAVSNSDPVTHNVRSFPIRSRPFNFGQPPGSEPRERVFEAAEREIEIQCDIHPWMHAFIFVMDHPYFCVTDDDGSYTIEDLPPGEYMVESWHEKFGRQRQSVTVADTDSPDVNFTYEPKS